jgi:pSer/pThr/pTyr-binding forkhead associated (FHA) protein
MLKLRFINKEHGDVWLVEPSVLIGSDAACQVSLRKDDIKPRHVDIQIKGDQLTLVNLAGDPQLTINGKPVGKQSALNTGDTVAIAGMSLLVVDPKAEAKPLADVQASTGWAIRPNHSALANKIYSINGPTVIGRSNECDLNFSVTHLSRKHAQLSIVSGHLVVKDMGSANGTFVNGKRLDEGKEAKLDKGDELRLDTLSFTVIGPGGESDRTTVRSAVTIPLAAAKADIQSTTQQTQKKPAPAAEQSAAAAERERKRVAGTTAFNRAVTASEEAQQEVVKSKANWVVVAVALVAVIGIVVYMFK